MCQEIKINYCLSQLLEEEERLADEEERFYCDKTNQIRQFYSERSSLVNNVYNLHEVFYWHAKDHLQIVGV